MSNLVKLTGKGSSDFDWTTIQDHTQRNIAKTAVANYDKEFDKLKDKAAQLIEQNTLNLSRCVLILKETLDHGDFREVTQQALKLDKDKSAALVYVGKAIMQGTVPAEALQLLDKMEPRAGQKFLKADEETKSRYVATFEETGRVPSQRDFAPTKNHHVVTFEEQTPSVPESIDTVVVEVGKTADFTTITEPADISLPAVGVPDQLKALYQKLEAVVQENYREIQSDPQALKYLQWIADLNRSYFRIGS